MKRPTKESFLKDVDRHAITVVHDSGIYRHVRCNRPGTVIMSFDVVTYPGYLCYSGDMGCFVFSRLDDMFEFFRHEKEDELAINPRYWHEKLQATDRPDGSEEYDEDIARANINEHIENNYADRPDYKELKQAVIDDVLNHAGTEYELREALYSFDFNGRNPFADSWEWRFQSYTFRYIWCLYAIVWAIRQYDAVKAGQKVQQ